MKLLIKRNQKSGSFTGKISFILEVRAELTPEEEENVKKYKMGKTMLYTNLADRGAGIIGAVHRAAVGIEITVDSLVKGRVIDCKDVLEMLAVEEQVKEACAAFSAMLTAAATFGGEEVLEF